MMSSLRASIRGARSSASGASASSNSACPGLMSRSGAGVMPAFRSSLVVAVKAWACQLSAQRGVPLSGWSVRELQGEVVAQGLVAEISGTTLAKREQGSWRQRLQLRC